MTRGIAAVSTDLSAGLEPDRSTARLSGLLDPAFLVEAGWDAALLVMFPPPAHRLLGRPICQAPGCETTAMGRDRICQSCSRRLAISGLGPDQLVLLPARGYPVRGPDACRVEGCGREWASASVGLCRTHGDQCQPTGLTVEQFCTDAASQPLPAHPRCSVASCPRQRRHADSRYCEPHQLRLRSVRRADPGFDEARIGSPHRAESQLMRLAVPAVGMTALPWAGGDRTPRVSRQRLGRRVSAELLDRQTRRLALVPVCPAQTHGG